MVRSLALAVVAALPQGPGDHIAHWQERLADLARPDDRHGTFGPTGRRLWATRLEPALGFRGDFHYVQHTPGLTDVLRIELVDAAGTVLPVEVTGREWQPSHSTVRYSVGGGGHIVEHKWITDDDVLVTRLRVRGIAEFGVRWSSPIAEEPTGDLRRFTPVSLARLANEDLRTSSALRIGTATTPVWIEAEDAERRGGACHVERRAAASGGSVLRDGAAGGEASYAFLSPGEGRWTLVARYTRTEPDEARLSVTVRGADAGELRCPPTAGGGGSESDFGLATLALGAIAAGPSELRIAWNGELAGTALDGFFLLPSTEGAPALPPREQWRSLDPMRGALVLPGGRITVHGVPFAVLPPMGPQGVVSEEPIDVGGSGAVLHVLAIPLAADASLSCGGVTRRLGARARTLQDSAVALEVPAAGDLRLHAQRCVVIAATREDVRARGDVEVRRGYREWHGIGTEVRASLHGLVQPWHVSAPGDRDVELTFAVECTGDRVPMVATQRAVAGDALARHVRAYASWFAERAPRLRASDELLQRLWTYRWFLVRHALAWPEAGYLRGGPVLYEGRHGSWYPRVITFSTPHIVAETRWLADSSLFLGNVRALVAAQTESGELPNLTVDTRRGRYDNWLPAAVVDAFAVHDDARALEQMLPALMRQVEGTAAAFDPDGDGLLVSQDHYATGMEFQPAFWAFADYDDSKPPAQLARPDLNSYHFANASALAAAAAWLQRDGDAARMAQLAERTEQAVLAKLWHAEDGFFYSARAADGALARCKEVVGCYPIRFGIATAGGGHGAALAALLDPAQFWTAFPPASCSQEVPAYSAAVQRWPAAGGVTAPCMWNGPTWPHAVSVAADALASALREREQSAVRPAQLGDLLRRYALFHCEGGDPKRPLLREYGNADTGEGQGCPDYLHSTFIDLLIRHAAGLVPRFDDVLQVRPLALRLGDLEIEDLPYHGHRVGIAIRGDELTVTLDGEVAGQGSAQRGLTLAGVVR